ncbi:MAG: beta-glucuronidase [Verrucomicrobia bacterium]|nr:beta-glucuronidase [Verrucomicrobiota bacterium]MCH8527652.1 beta-glucuronidase [Kiritimatiellia bacterium]
MLRAFVEHIFRPVSSLEGLWDFHPDTGPDDHGVPSAFTRQIEVPSAWETLPDLKGFRGTGWYRKTFSVESKGHVRLVFGGVSHTATVFLDGKQVGHHYDAFTPFDVILTDLEPGPHELLVKVDNSFGDHSALHIPNDYYTYGGITRPVELHTVGDLFIDKLFATPKRTDAGWALACRVRIRNVGHSEAGGEVRISVADHSACLSLPDIAPGASVEVDTELFPEAVEAWSAENPKLYRLNARLLRDGDVVDDKIERIGFREIRVEGPALLLNGRPLVLRGFNRHEDHPQFGCAIPPAGMAADLALFEDLHCNFLRTSHYPNDMRMLDMCDERGIYVWEESHSRQTPFQKPMFDAQIRQSTIEMVENHFNHPCVLMWGSVNECDTASDYGVEVHREVLGLLKRLDGSRPTTYAGHLGKADRCHGFADIVSWNIYVGWYVGQPGRTAEDLEERLRWLDSPASLGGDNKPLIISEFGAGAIYGVRNPQADPWSEEFQVVVLDEALRVYLNHPRVTGAAIWQFCDVRVTREGNNETYNSYSPMGRPRCMNNKGVVDEFRRPKLSYAAVKSRMAAAKQARDSLC